MSDPPGSDLLNVRKGTVYLQADLALRGAEQALVSKAATRFVRRVALSSLLAL